MAFWNHPPNGREVEVQILVASFTRTADEECWTQGLYHDHGRITTQGNQQRGYRETGLVS